MTEFNPADYASKPNEPPIMNTAMEDALAHVPEEAGRELVIKTWLVLGRQYLCRQVGRARAKEFLQTLARSVDDDRPARDYPA